MSNAKMISQDAEMKGSTQLFRGGRGCCCLGGAALGRKVISSVVRETVVLITCINQDHDGLVHKVFLVFYWKQNMFLRRKERKQKPDKLGASLCRKAECNWFYFSTLRDNVLKDWEKFSCVAPERFTLILWQLPWLSFFLNAGRTQSSIKSK